MDPSAPPGEGAALGSEPLPWISVAPEAPYFITEHGRSWTPIGQNDSITWREFSGLIGGRDLPGVERHLRWLKDSGVTCLRFMLEYCERDDAFLERPAGCFDPGMVRLWDDLIGLCERVGLHLLLTPYDTFFIWNNWERHPYNAAQGGPCAGRTQLLSCPRTRAFIKERLAFATRRWGGSGAVFAWDLWNEIHPVQGEDKPRCFEDFIEDVGPFLRDLERRLHGRAHLQTVSIFGPELIWKPWLNEPIFRHPLLDFANAHLYAEGSIDFPRDTVAAAIDTGRLMREWLAEITDARPLFDTEHGPIHSFKDHGITLPEPLDDEYFRHMQWAHLASGGAGGGMRWPNRGPHELTRGMRRAQRALADFLPLIDWPRFRRRNLHGEAAVHGEAMACFTCGDAEQAVAWLLRTATIGADGMLDRTRPPARVRLYLPGLAPGRYRAVWWDTERGVAIGAAELVAEAAGLTLSPPPFTADLAIAVRRSG